MQLNPYGEETVRLATDLAIQRPRSPGELASRSSTAGVVVEQPPDAGDLADFDCFLDRWLAVVDESDPLARARLLNALLAETSAHPRLTDHAGNGWHLHYRESGLTFARQLGALISVGTALHLTGRGMDRLHRCALAECAKPFGDFTRGGRQRYCSPACANRDAVRRHRAKQRAYLR